MLEISTWIKVFFQDAVSPIMEQLIMFHDHTIIIIISILIVVLYIIISLFINKYVNRFLFEGQIIELIWTALPALILIFIAIPSLRLLYMLDEVNNPLVSIKIIGHQWYWSYEYSDFKLIEFDSYIKPLFELNRDEFRILETDNRVILPFNTKTRILVTSMDVIHSWTVPSLGLKIDASPGRLNQGILILIRPGLFFGQCSEICGTNHRFIPIIIERVNINIFISWLSKFYIKFLECKYWSLKSNYSM